MISKLEVFALFLVATAAALVGFANADWKKTPEILNVSYDPTREVYQELNAGFTAQYQSETGARVRVEQSHGGSSRQARLVAEGLAADVVTLALPSDIDSLARVGLLPLDWVKRLPQKSQPYFSTIVFVVRKGNPQRIKDWPDLARPGIAMVTPDPKTSGNGKLSVLAAWGSGLRRSGTEEQARDYLRRLYLNVEVLGQGARDAATRFVLEKQGDVLLTWENEALREARDSSGELEIVYPSISIRAEPSVAWVDGITTKHQTTAIAREYLAYLFTKPAQETFAKHGYRPVDEEVLRAHQDQFPPIELFPITSLARDWDDAQGKFFGENGIFEAIRPTRTK